MMDFCEWSAENLDNRNFHLHFLINECGHLFIASYISKKAMEDELW